MRADWSSGLKLHARTWRRPEGLELAPVGHALVQGTPVLFYAQTSFRELGVEAETCATIRVAVSQPDHVNDACRHREFRASAGGPWQINRPPLVFDAWPAACPPK